MNIYQIEQSYLKLADQLTNDEVTPELEAELAITETQMQEKGRNYGFIIKQLESDCDQIDNEIKRLQALKKTRTNSVDRLKSTLSQAMQLFNIEEIKTATLKINFRKSKSIEIISESQLDRKYFTIKTMESVSKTLIKADIDQGIEVAGAVQIESFNLQIK